jgi:hypothetical protein
MEAETPMKSFFIDDHAFWRNGQAVEGMNFPSHCAQMAQYQQSLYQQASQWFTPIPEPKEWETGWREPASEWAKIP